MPVRKKSWREKLANDNDLPRVVEMDQAMSKRWAGGTCVIPSRREVDELMRRVGTGRLQTIDQLRDALARRHGATMACPMTTGIFAWIAAHAAAEAQAAKEKNTTPFWRTLKSRGELNPKYPGGIGALKQKLRAEGHTVKQKGKHFFVEDFDARLAVLGD